MDISKIEKINTFLRNKGYDLRKIKGYSDDNVISKALSKEDALNALDLYCYLEIPILGGDVFYLNQNKDNENVQQAIELFNTRDFHHQLNENIKDNKENVKKMKI